MRDFVLNVLHCPPPKARLLAFSPAAMYRDQQTLPLLGAKDIDLCLLTSVTSAIQILDDHRLLAKEPMLPQISFPLVMCLFQFSSICRRANGRLQQP
jgi:hypothetical protein